MSIIGKLKRLPAGPTLSPAGTSHTRKQRADDKFDMISGITRPVWGGGRGALPKESGQTDIGPGQPPNLSRAPAGYKAQHTHHAVECECWAAPGQAYNLQYESSPQPHRPTEYTCRVERKAMAFPSCWAASDAKFGSGVQGRPFQRAVLLRGNRSCRAKPPPPVETPGCFDAGVKSAAMLESNKGRR